MDKYLDLFNLADASDSEITEVLKEIQTEPLKNLDEWLKKEFKEKNFVFGDLSKEEVLISVQIASQYFRLISLIGLELLKREN